MGGICIRNNRIFTVDVQTLDFTGNHLREAVCSMSTVFLGKFNTPCFFKFSDNSRILNLLIAGEITGLSTHIAGTLNVVLSTDRVYTTTGLTNLTNHHSHVGHGHNAFCTG